MVPTSGIVRLIREMHFGYEVFSAFQELDDNERVPCG